MQAEGKEDGSLTGDSDPDQLITRLLNRQPKGTQGAVPDKKALPCNDQGAEDGTLAREQLIPWYMIIMQRWDLDGTLLPVYMTSLHVITSPRASPFILA